MSPETVSIGGSESGQRYGAIAKSSTYESDGESALSTDAIGNRYRLMSPDIDRDDFVDEDFVEDLTAPTTSSKEFSYIRKNSFLITLTFLMEYSLTIMSLLVIGHVCKSSDALASASLAVMTYNITGMAFVEGMATSLDTFCSQAYGAKKYTKVGLYTFRCATMILTGIFPVIVLWWCSASWLGYVIAEQDILPDIQLFLRIISFGLPGLITFETGKRFLQAQGHFQAGTYALLFTVPVNVFLVYSLTRIFGYAGAPLGIALSHWFMAIMLLLYCKVWRKDTLICWYPIFSSMFHFKRLFCSWKPMWDLAFPGLLMIEAEYLSFEVLTIMSTYLGVKAIAAQSVISNIGSLIYQVPFAIGCVVSTRVANYIGMECITNAKISIKAAYCVAAFVGVVNFSVILSANKNLAYLFTKDKEVIELCGHVAPILAVNQLYDAFTTFSAAILRAQGRQQIGSMLNIFAYYFIALPLSGWLTFGRLQLGLKGLWYGCGTGILLLAFALSYCVYNSNWDDIVEECLRREKEETEIDLESMTSNSSNIIGV
ncbi:unnamed protein product [Kluyveromyces dobzhanskii CBS 2104]|uniref:WGS project CCBQ000000000 data, contig 00099 n=1 Tax=Kluyveromyces dobzhanskii CBS 2104 TaxID=1427455 RepID=A0A0A8L4Y5_9SACH|nr:unnamed protein product [Kluyveromyces dobzhanskii CBS 2104]